MRRPPVRRWLDWLFRSRETGRITIAQFPNPALWIFLVASLGRSLADRSGALADWLGIVASGALIWWAADEVVRGVNPWRRLLGATVLAGRAVRFFAG